MDENIVYIGTIVQIKGFRGGFIVSDLQPDQPNLKKGAEVNIGYSMQFSHPYTIDSWKTTKLTAQVKLHEIRTDKDADSLKEMGVFVDKKELISADEKYVSYDEAVGCMLIEEDTEEEIGKILEVWETPANRVWLVAYKDKEVTIPVIDDVVKHIDYKNKVILVKMIDGLLDI